MTQAGCLMLLLLLAFVVAMPVTTEVAEPAPIARTSSSSYPESASSSSTDVLSPINRSCRDGCLEECLSHCEDVYIKRFLSKVPSGRCLVHVVLHKMFRNDSLVAANISWGTVGRKELALSPTLEPCPEDELASAGLGSQCLVSWEVSSGGLTGNLLTESSSVQLSLWPETNYRVQVSCRSKRTNIFTRSPILKLNTSTAAETVAAAATWEPPPQTEIFEAGEDGGWPYGNRKPEEPDDKVVRDTKPEVTVFVGLLIFLFVVFLSMLMAAASPDPDSDRDGTHPEADAMMGNDEPMVEIQHV